MATFRVRPKKLVSTSSPPNCLAWAGRWLLAAWATDAMTTSQFTWPVVIFFLRQLPLDHRVEVLDVGERELDHRHAVLVGLLLLLVQDLESVPGRRVEDFTPENHFDALDAFRFVPNAGAALDRPLAARRKRTLDQSGQLAQGERSPESCGWRELRP